MCLINPKREQKEAVFKRSEQPLFIVRPAWALLRVKVPNGDWQ